MTGVDRWRSSRRGWALTAAVLAATVCLACWPRPTLGVLGIVVGTGALLAGLRGLLAEHRRQAPAEPSDDLTAQEARDLADDRCCVCGGPETPYENYRGQLFCWPCADCPCGQVPCVRTGINDPAVSAQAANRPDASGRDPETARTHPDAGGEQRADQGGDHPDASGQHAGPAHAMLAALAQSIAALPAPAPRHPDAALRGRVAAALLARIKQATISGPQPFGTDPLTRFLAANEYDLADVVLAELAPELDALAALHQGEEPYTDEACVPTPAQWIWRWNHATPAQRLEIADRVLTNAERLTATHAVVLRLGDPHDDLALHVRAALLGNPPPVVHRTAEQPVSRPQPVDESADDRGEVVQ